MAKADVTTLNGLAAKIQDLTQQFTTYLKENQIPEPSFAVDSPTSYNGLDGPSFVLRQALFDNLMDLVYLTQGPSESVFNYLHTVGPDTSTLNVLNHFDFWAAVPLDGSASYEEISQKTTLPASVCQRLVEHGTTLRLFTTTTDPATGTIRVHHTSRSAAIAKNQGLKAFVSTILDDAAPPLTVMPEALRRYTAGKPALAQKMDETAFAVLHKNGPFGSFETSWDLLENDGEGERKGWRQRNFVAFMRYVNEIFQFEKIIEEGYDWEGAGKIQVVDIGGSGGHDSIALAKKFPQLTLTVQDLGEAEPVFNATLPAELKDRVSFKAHNFFDKQTIQADVFLMKLILHDWPDKESAQILRNLIPGMKPGSKLLFIDYVGKQTDDGNGQELPRSLQAFGTATDIRMMALFNHRERLVHEWKDVFRMADERFELTRVEADPLTFVVLMEVTWRG